MLAVPTARPSPEREGGNLARRDEQEAGGRLPGHGEVAGCPHRRQHPPGEGNAAVVVAAEIIGRSCVCFAYAFVFAGVELYYFRLGKAFALAG